MKYFLPIFFFLCLAYISEAQNISTVVGTGVAGYNGDNITGISAALNGSYQITFDKKGNLFIADYANHRVRKVTPAGIITTVAGNGTGGYSGDGGQATSAELYYPEGVALDTAGNLYISDNGNSVIRKVTPAGIITTIAGNHELGYGGDGGPATSAEFYNPGGISLDKAGNLFIADIHNSRIRKVDTKGIITTVAGTSIAGYNGDSIAATTAQLNNPHSVMVDSVGDIYIPDLENNRVRKVTAGTGIITTVAGNGNYAYSGDGGAATSAGLNPTGVIIDHAGNLYIADFANNAVRKVTASGIISTIAGTTVQGFSGDGEAATAAEFYHPFSVVFDTTGNLFIMDRENNRVRKISNVVPPVTPSPNIYTMVGTGVAGYNGDNIADTAAELNGSYQTTFDKKGNFYIADFANHRVRKVTPAGIISTVAGNGSGGYSGDDGQATSAELYYPEGVALDTAGNLYISDNGNSVIRKVSPGGIITTIAGTHVGGFSGDGGLATNAELYNPGGISLDKAGNLFIADIHNNRIRKIDTKGIITTVAGTGVPGYNGDSILATAAELNNPHSVTVDTAGNIYIPDIYDNRIRKVSASSNIIVTIAGNGTEGYSGDNGLATLAQLNNPSGVGLDTAGNVYIADFDNNVVRKLTISTGLITTIAGTGTQGFSGDGGPATSAKLYNPFSVVFDNSNILYIMDRGNNRVRRVGKANNILPVTLTNFTAYSLGKGVQTAWTGYDEINMTGYEVEKSANGYQFNAIGSVVAKNNGAVQNSYTLFDASPLQGDNYYRVKAISKDGTIQYSGTVLVKIGNDAASIAVYPNPVANKTIQVHLNNIDAGAYQYIIYSATGQRVAAGSYTHTGGSAVVAINAAGLTKGIYHVVFKGSKSGYTLKVLVL